MEQKTVINDIPKDTKVFLAKLRETVEEAEKDVNKLTLSVPTIHESLYDIKEINEGVEKLILKEFNIEGKLSIEDKIKDILIVKLHEHESFFGGKFRNERRKNAASMFAIRLLSDELSPEFKKNWIGKCEFLFEVTGSDLTNAKQMLIKAVGLIPGNENLKVDDVKKKKVVRQF
jgi:hypothetical protein